jgi:hypothetical protein
VMLTASLQISITTPPHMHRNMSVQALKAGKHVLCDKPTCLNRSEGKTRAQHVTRAHVTIQQKKCVASLRNIPSNSP